jgi:hypothetical protein
MGQIKFDLRRALEDFEARTGIRLTYESLAQRTELSIETIKSIATRDDYNATLKNINSIFTALKSNPIDYMKWIENSRGLK